LRFYRMFVLNLEVPEMVNGVSSLKNLGQRETGHLDDRGSVNVHAKILLRQRVVI
jgi:hypothetical protein